MKGYNNAFILSIESSCDDTAAAVFQGKNLLSSVISTQIIHEKFGGVVPELASRDHQKNIVSVVDRAINLAGIGVDELGCIAYTQGPGLLGSLLVGCCFAKGLAMALSKPIIGINHMHAHVLSNFIGIDDEIIFPMMCLIVSGGHTQLVYVKNFLDLTVIGQTLDDAMGEAFDKIGKMMGLPYPSGSLIDFYAEKGNEYAYSFSNTVVPALDYSFSGIKTCFLNFLQTRTLLDKNFFETYKYDICASIQKKLVEMAMAKFSLAIERMDVRAVALAGGVAANSLLRSRVEELAIKKGVKAYLPEKKYCTDNAAMIGMVAYYKYVNQEFQNFDAAVPMPRMTL